jgi:hypothetical protein
MANNLQFTTPNGENLTFTITAQADGSNVLYSQSFTTAASVIYLKVYETGDVAKTSLDPANLVQGTLYDVEAFSDAGFTPGNEVDITTWGGTNIEFTGTTVDYTVPDRRPMHFAAYASQAMSPVDVPASREPAGDGTTLGVPNGEGWGVLSLRHRKVPAFGADASVFDTPATSTVGAADGNGPLTYVKETVDPLAGWGMERFSFAFISGWTRPYLTNWQGHYPAVPYTGMLLDSAMVLTEADDKTTAVESFTPFTPIGTQGLLTGAVTVPTETRGDLKTAWKHAVAYAKSEITTNGGTPEIACYAGYRPVYTDSTMSTIDRSWLGYSVQSDDGGWSGTGNSPGFTPEPGFDSATTNISNSDEAFSAWWDIEAQGVYQMGFDGIGLDTASGMWWNAEGMTRSTGDRGDRPGSDRLFRHFEKYDLKPKTEAISWQPVPDESPARGVPWTGLNADIYKAGPTWGLVDATMGWRGLTSDSGSVTEISGTRYMVIHNETGTSDGATAGNPSIGGSKLDTANSEVHAIWRFRNGGLAWMETYSWLAVRQIIWDFHNAGFICSTGGAPSGSILDKDGFEITAELFYTYIDDLSTGVQATRPQ